MSRVLGIVSFEDQTIRVEGINDYRPVSSISFLGRYRLIDYPISNMSNSDIKSFQIYVKEKPRSVFAHVGIGQQYNINSKQGKIRIMYGEAPTVSPIYNTDVTAYMENLQWIEAEDVEFVLIAPSHFVYAQDYRTMIADHQNSGADVTILFKNVVNAKEEFQNCTTLTLDKERRVIASDTNRGQARQRAMSLDCYVMRKEVFIDLVKRAHELSSVYWLKNMIMDNLFDLNVRGFSTRSDVYAITDLASYYRANMALLDPTKSTIFNDDWPVYTKTSDSAPTLYKKEANVRNSLIANGTVVNGSVVNSIIGRGVIIEKGALVENSIVLSNTYIGEDVHLDHTIADKHCHLSKTKEIIGSDNELVYIKRSDSI